MGLGRRGWALLAVAAIGALALVTWMLWPGPAYLYVRPSLGSYSGASMWGTTEYRRPHLDARAMEIAKRNPEARAILGKRYRVTGDWGDSYGLLLHVNLLGQPRSYEYDLPYSTYATIQNPPPDCAYPRYLVGWYHDVAHDVIAAAITVDLTRRRVIQIMTSGIHVVTWANGKPHPSCPAPLNP